MKTITINTHIDCSNNSKCSVRDILLATKQGAFESVFGTFSVSSLGSFTHFFDESCRLPTDTPLCGYCTRIVVVVVIVVYSGLYTIIVRISDWIVLFYFIIYLTWVVLFFLMYCSGFVFNDSLPYLNKSMFAFTVI